MDTNVLGTINVHVRLDETGLPLNRFVRTYTRCDIGDRIVDDLIEVLHRAGLQDIRIAVCNGGDIKNSFTVNAGSISGCAFGLTAGRLVERRIQL